MPDNLTDLPRLPPPTGAAGPAVGSGARAAAGPSGPAVGSGARAAAGPAGATGPAGSTGATGPAGSTGPAGRTGRGGGAGRSGAGGGRGEYLDRATLVRVAADVADREGWSRLTLSGVAKEVGRHVTSLYAHVDSLDALRREVALLSLDELTDAVWRAAIGRIREDALSAIARVYREFARGHPGRSAAIALVSHTDEQVRQRGARLAEPIRATFRSFGLDETQAAIAHRVFSATVIGFGRAEASDQYPPESADEAFDEAVRLFVVALGTGSWPCEPAPGAVPPPE